MSQKYTETRSINGAFTFKGEGVYKIAEAFFDWCDKIEAEFDVTLLSNRADYNGYLPTDRTDTEDK